MLFADMELLSKDQPPSYFGAAAVGALAVVDITQRPEQDAFVGTVKFHFAFCHCFCTSSYYKVVVIKVPLQGQNATIDKVLWIGLNLLPQDGFGKAPTTALCF